MAAEKRSNDARVTYLTEFELSQPPLPPQPPHPMLQHERLSAIKTSTIVANSLPPETSSDTTKAMSALAISKRDDDDASTASSCSGQGKETLLHT